MAKVELTSSNVLLVLLKSFVLFQCVLYVMLALSRFICLFECNFWDICFVSVDDGYS